MVQMRKVLLLIFMSLIFRAVSAQELNCMISVVSQQVQGSNREIYDNLQKAMTEFVNQQNWTDHVFKEEERIQCQLMFNITDRISDNEFQGTLQIQSSRPIFGTSQTTVMFNHRDNDIHFKYDDFEPLRFNETQFTSNLVSLLAYYVNIILGLDYDSFGSEGGTLFFQRAEAIRNNAQNAAESGWKAFESTRNRYWLVENILNDKYRAVRSCLYRYHRMGLDRMVERVDEARAEIADALIDFVLARRHITGAILQGLILEERDRVIDRGADLQARGKTGIGTVNE